MHTLFYNPFAQLGSSSNKKMQGDSGLLFPPSVIFIAAVVSWKSQLKKFPPLYKILRPHK